MGTGQNINIKRSLENVDSSPCGWLWGVQNFCGGSKCRLVEMARELELEEPEAVTELLQSHEKSWMDKFLLRDEQSKWFLEMEPTGEDNWEGWNGNKGFRISHELSWYSSSRVSEDWLQFWKKFYCHAIKCCQTALRATGRWFIKRRVNWCCTLHYCLILRNCHNHLSLQPPPPWSVSSLQHGGKTLNQQKDYDSLKAQMIVSIF